MKQRISYQSEYPYFITSNIKDKTPYFDILVYAQIISKNIFFYSNQGNYLLYSYIIMPDHIHIIVKQSDKNISKFMEGVKSYTKKEMNIVSTKCKQHGTIWQKSFHYRILRTKEIFFNALQYTKNNPVKAGLEEKYIKFPYYFCNKNLISNIIYP